MLVSPGQGRAIELMTDLVSRILQPFGKDCLRSAAAAMADGTLRASTRTLTQASTRARARIAHTLGHRAISDSVEDDSVV